MRRRSSPDPPESGCVMLKSPAGARRPGQARRRGWRAGGDVEPRVQSTAMSKRASAACTSSRAEVVGAVVVEQVGSTLEYSDGFVPGEPALVEDAVDLWHVGVDVLREMLAVVVLRVSDDVVGDAGRDGIGAGQIQQRQGGVRSRGDVERNAVQVVLGVEDAVGDEVKPIPHDRLVECGGQVFSEVEQGKTGGSSPVGRTLGLKRLGPAVVPKGEFRYSAAGDAPIVRDG